MISSLDFLRRNFGRVREFTPGGPAALLPTVAGQAGVLICNEAMFPEVAAERVRGGAQYLVNLSNDNWLNDRKFSEITFNMIAFRAIEQRRYLVRASTSGPSAVVDPYGRVLARTEELHRALAHEKELGEMKSNFVSLVSHEFRTPLGVIMSAVEVLQRYFERLPADKRARHLEMIFRSTKNLANLIEEVLLLGRVEEGRMQFAPGPLDLEKLDAPCAVPYDRL